MAVRRLVAVVLAGSVICPGPASAATPPTFLERFSQSDGLITNEFAYWSPTNPKRVTSSRWELTSGSLFVRNRHGWTGVPDAGFPDARSSAHNDSAVFRLTTVRDDFRNVDVRFRLDNLGYVTTSRTPRADWDGVHIFLRYQDETELYYASVNRRDGTTAIKKKVTGGTSNGGTYYTLAAGGRGKLPGRWQSVRVTIRTRTNGAVAINLYLDGRKVLTGVDDGTVGGPPILAAGKTGIRGDNCRFLFDDFAVRKL